PIILSASFSGGPGAPAIHELSGRVPQKAVTAVLALRINTECNCFGSANIDIGLTRYHDNRTGQTVQQAFRLPSASRNTATGVQIRARPGQVIEHNTQSFSVTT